MIKWGTNGVTLCLWDNGGAWGRNPQVGGGGRYPSVAGWRQRDCPTNAVVMSSPAPGKIDRSPFILFLLLSISTVTVQPAQVQSPNSFCLDSCSSSYLVSLPSLLLPSILFSSQQWQKITEWSFKNVNQITSLSCLKHFKMFSFSLK